MMLEGCPANRGGTVFLRGGPAALKAAKVVLSWLLHACCNLEQEGCALLDQGLLPTRLLQALVTPDLPAAEAATALWRAPMLQLQSSPPLQDTPGGPGGMQSTPFLAADSPGGWRASPAAAPGGIRLPLAELTSPGWAPTPPPSASSSARGPHILPRQPNVGTPRATQLVSSAHVLSAMLLADPVRWPGEARASSIPPGSAVPPLWLWAPGTAAASSDGIHRGNMGLWMAAALYHACLPTLRHSSQSHSNRATPTSEDSLAVASQFAGLPAEVLVWLLTFPRQRDTRGNAASRSGASFRTVRPGFAVPRAAPPDPIALSLLDSETAGPLSPLHLLPVPDVLAAAGLVLAALPPFLRTALLTELGKLGYLPPQRRDGGHGSEGVGEWEWYLGLGEPDPTLSTDRTTRPDKKDRVVVNIAAAHGNVTSEHEREEKADNHNDSGDADAPGKVHEEDTEEEEEEEWPGVAPAVLASSLHEHTIAA